MTFLRYWPWWMVFALMLAYEAWAVSTQLRHLPRRRPTLSELVWAAQKRYPPLKWIVLAALGVLYAHFFLGLWR